VTTSQEHETSATAKAGGGPHISPDERFSNGLVRVGPPRETDADPLRTWGGQFEWCWGVPLIIRGLTLPRVDLPIPANPVDRTIRCMPDPGVLGYWAALQYVLTYSLGWSRHDRGLRAWYDARKPTDTPALRLLSDVWDSDGNLDAYLWWTHRNGLSAGGALSREHGTVPTGDELSPIWTRQLKDSRSCALEYQGLTNSEDPRPDGLHLEMGDHISGWGSIDEVAQAEGTLTVKSSTARTAVFEMPSLAGWHTRLTQLGNTLAQDKSKSWHVDVYVRNVGYLGVYRRSWKTGLWFSGPHRYHSMGQED
jgi:hypothetical protein